MELTGAGELRVLGNVIAYYSDERLKNIQKPIGNALSIIDSWRAVHYTANETAVKFGYDADKPEIGLIVQDVEKDFPEIIAEAAIGEGYKTIQYDKITAILVAALQEQIAINDSLIARIENLENKIDK